jgi:asparaginyl-tRNA synthetase
MTAPEGIPAVTISRVHEHVGEVVRLQGWLYQRAGKGKLHFLKLRDGTGFIQCVVFKGDVDEEVFAQAGKTKQECSLEVWGEVRQDDRAPFMPYEISVQGLRLIQVADEDYPISPKEHGTGFLMDHRHLWLRSRKQHAVLRIRHEVISAIRDFFNERDFTNLDAPIFTPAACEGTSTLFETEYFGSKAYLSQSGQLYMEAGAAAFGKVYCFGPTFRAEKSKTRRHLTEFWMVEPEVAYMDLEGDMELAEDFIVYIVQRVLKNRRTELETLERDITALEKIQKPFPRVSYDEAHAILEKLGTGHVDGDDFGAEDETRLVEQYDRPVIVHRWPADIKAFYMKRDPEDHSKVLAMDIIAPEGYGEIIGGSQREDDFDLLLERIEKHNLPREAFEWYLDLRQYGSFPHSGFGLGLERTVTWLCGIHHLRETIPFPRMIDRLTP